jgi:pimeloyl-ACP methyl ester carboxylesterase
MGTSVATELLARRERDLLPFDVASLVLMNGSVHVELAHLTVGQRVLRSPLGPLFAKLSTKATFMAQIRRVFARPPSDAELEAMWELVAREDGPARLPQLIAYIGERSRFRRRWIGALERFDRPALVAWGRKDPVAVLAIAEQLVREIPGCDMTLWNELGHYPQVEDPARVVKDVEAFWDRVHS